MAVVKKPFHETVAEKLIEQLKKGTAPWQKPWQPGESAFLPTNPTTGNRYRGINAIHLLSQDRADPRWLTYKQAEAVGGQVRQGERGTAIQYWKFTEDQVARGENGEAVKVSVKLERPRVFFATVFNAEQIDGLQPLPPRKEPDWQAVERAEQILQASGAVIRLGEQDRAFYRPATDTIHLPAKNQFSSAEKFYAVALHELGHWTGVESRLNRDLTHPFGSEGYAKEELRAEIASMLLGDELGLGHDPEQHAAYVGSWIKVLRDDPLEVFRAAAAAEKIEAYVLSFEQQQIKAEIGAQEGIVSTQEREAQMVQQASRTQVEPEPRFYIQVPFEQKNEAKALGARWDRQRQSWYVPAGIEAAPFAKWEPLMMATDTRPWPADQNKNKRQYLVVPFGERLAAKAAGAKWDKAAKSWYVGPEANLAQLARWQPGNAAGEQSPAMTAKDEFAEALRSLGCVVSGEHPIMDGKKHRISVQGEAFSENAGAGFYVGHLDGHPAGYIKNNRTGLNMKWRSKGYALDPGESAQRVKEVAAAQQARAEERARRQEQAAQRVCQQMTNLVPAIQPTPYMQAKGIAPQAGAFTDEEGRTTYIPATDVHGKQWSTQYIREDGSKRFAKDSRKEGCFHAVGGLDALALAPALVIGEGYATASSLSQCLGFATVAAFDAGNLAIVATALHEKFPDKPVVVAGDDDWHLEETLGVNPGRTKAREAAQATNGLLLLPIFAPGERAGNPKRFTDFNDLANNSELGWDGLNRQVREVIELISPKPQAPVPQAERVQQQSQKQGRGMKIG